MNKRRAIRGASDAETGTILFGTNQKVREAKRNPDGTIFYHAPKGTWVRASDEDASTFALIQYPPQYWTGP